MAEMNATRLAEVDTDDLRRLAGRRDVGALATSLRLAVGEPEPRRVDLLHPPIPSSEAETTSSSAAEEPDTAEGDSDG